MKYVRCLICNNFFLDPGPHIIVNDVPTRRCLCDDCCIKWDNKEITQEDLFIRLYSK